MNISHTTPSTSASRSVSVLPSPTKTVTYAPDTRNAPPTTHQAAGRSRLMTKLGQLLDFRKLDAEPALRLAQNWEVATAEICAMWMNDQEMHQPSKVSRVLLSKMKAMEYERKHAAELDQRVFPELQSEQDFQQAEIAAFLEALGLDAKEVLDSMDAIGTGLQDRHAATTATVIKSGVAITRQAIPDPAVKLGLSVADFILECVNANQIIGAAEKRFHTSGAEEIVPLGKCDDSPTAKKAPDILHAAHNVIWKLRKANTVVREVEDARQALEQTEHAEQTPQARNDARQALELAFAKHCHQMQVKEDYKAASNSGKKEWYGNLGRNVVGITGGTGMMSAGLLSIMTPAILAAPVTAGVSGGALLLFLSLYLGYHFSDHPKKDAKRKAQRAILNAAKSIDVLTEESRSTYKERAQSHRTYKEKLKEIARTAPRFPTPAQQQSRREREAAARVEHLERLTDISRRDGDAASLTARRNWERFRDYARALHTNPDNAAAITAEFEVELERSVEAKTVSERWKTGISMRMDSAMRMLAGKIARVEHALITLQSGGKGIKSIVHGAAAAEARQQKLQELKDRLFATIIDALNLVRALNTMVQARQVNYASPELRELALALAARSAAQAMAGIADADLRALFSGDAQAQVAATHLAKSMTFGERDRYFWTTVGGAAYGIASNLAFSAGDIGVAAAKLDGTYHLLKVNDSKFLKSPQSGATAGTYATSAARTGIKENDLKPWQAALRQAGQAGPHAPKKSNQLGIDLEDHRREVYDRNDPAVAHAVRAFVDQLASERSVPESFIALKGDAWQHLVRDFLAWSTGDLAGIDKPIEIKLVDTQGFYQSLLGNLPQRERLAFQLKEAGWGVNQMFNSIGAPFVQPWARINLGKSRDAMNALRNAHPEIRRLLAAHAPVPD